MKIPTFLTLIITLLLVLGIALYGYEEGDRALSELGTNELQVHTLYFANDLSSLVERAEGHIYLYLMLGNPEDRDKFHLRIKTLNEIIDNLELILDPVGKRAFIHDIRSSVWQMSQIANVLIKARNGDLALADHNDQLTTLHNLSRSISQAGLDLADESTSRIQGKKGLVIDEVKKGRLTISLMSLFLSALLITLHYQSKRLTRARDLSKLLSKQSLVDQLTGIGNRRAFEKRLSREWKRAVREERWLSLLLVDIDCFKAYSDNYGNLEGERALSRIACTLDACLKRPTDSIARYNGETFAVILPDTENGAVIAEACRSSVEQLRIHHEHSEVAETVTISIGLTSCMPGTDMDAEAFFNDVNEALIHAQGRGRNRVHIHRKREACTVTKISALS